jgi:hypothetical protein
MDIDMDAVLAQREDATGQAGDTFTFVYKGQPWVCKDPLLADDSWKSELRECVTDVDVAVHHLGEDQYEKFVDAGGRSGIVVLAIREHMKSLTDEVGGRPTRPSKYSASTRKHSKRT